MRVTQMQNVIVAIILLGSGWLHVRAGRAFPDLPLGLALAVWGSVMLGWGHRRYVWMASCALCACLLVFAAYAWISGETDCGCFPGINVHPAITTILDIAMLTSLLTCRPLRQTQEARHERGLGWVFAASAILLFAFAWWAVPRATDQPWPKPLDNGNWRVIAVREGCEHCSAALSWIIPMANASPDIALVSYTTSGDWLRRRGLSASVPVIVRPSRWDPAPSGWIVRDGIIQRSFPIPESTATTSDDE